MAWVSDYIPHKTMVWLPMHVLFLNHVNKRGEWLNEQCFGLMGIILLFSTENMKLFDIFFD